MELRTEKPDITAKNYLSVGPGEYPCGNYLYLIVTPSGGRRWAFRYQRNGIVKKMGLGSAKIAGLKLSEAKDKAIDALRLLAKGTDAKDATGRSRRVDRMPDSSGLPRATDINRPARPVWLGRNPDMPRQSA